MRLIGELKSEKADLESQLSSHTASLEQCQDEGQLLEASLAEANRDLNLAREEIKKHKAKVKEKHTVEDFKRRLAGVPYPSLGGGHWVKSSSDMGRYVFLEDNSLWEISMLDRLETSLWIGMASIVVLENPQGVYPYRLANTSKGEVVEATCLSTH